MVCLFLCRIIIYIFKITCLGYFDLKASDFFVGCTSIIRIRSPPSKTQISTNFEFLEVFMIEKSYDELNKYDFIVKYYLHFAIGTKFEDFVEITKEEYKDLKNKLNNSKDAMIEVFATYSVGFYKAPETYVVQTVDKDVYYCLFKSQRYEKNKRKHEGDRYLDKYFNQENVDKIPSKNNVENEVLEKIDDLELQNKLDALLTKSQKERLCKNILLDYSLVEIAKEEGTDAAAIYRTIERAIKRLIKNL